MQLQEERTNKKHHRHHILSLTSAVIAIAAISFAGIAFAEAEDTPKKVSRIDGDDLKNNPTAAKILKNIEIAKQRIEQLKEVQKEKTEYQKHIEEQRRLAKAHLEKDLESMNKQYEEFTPRSAFGKFVSSQDSKYHNIYWNQFDYMDSKVKVATQARNKILQNGGSYAQAQSEFNKYASMSRVELINVIQDANIQNRFSDKHTQTYFDANGKLPRFEDDSMAPTCYGCEKYETLKQAVLEDKPEKVRQLTNSFAINKAPVDTPKAQPNDNQDKTTKNTETSNLKTQLTNLKHKFMGEKNLEEQKETIKEMNSIIQKMQKQARR